MNQSEDDGGNFIEESRAVLNPIRTYRAVDLLTWNHAVPETKIGFLPPNSCLPNPCLYGEILIATTMSPGRVVAIDMLSGEVRWLTPLAYYGTTPVAVDGYLFVATARQLLSLSLDTGGILWEFTPYIEGKERIYSLPVYSEGMVYIGDRRGRLHCLDAATGNVRWSEPVAIDGRGQLNATSLVYEGIIIAASNAGELIARDKRTGQVVWQNSISHGSADQVQLWNGMALALTRETLYGLSPQSGEILHRWEWSGREILAVACTGSKLCVSIRNPTEQDNDELFGELVGLDPNRELWRLPYPQYTRPGLSWNPVTNLVYESTYLGLSLVEPESGRRVALICDFDVDGSNEGDDTVSIPSIQAGQIYVVTQEGTICKLLHPNVGGATHLQGQ